MSLQTSNENIHPIVKIQSEINKTWNSDGIRDEYLNRKPRPGSNKFTILDGPPFATGLPHYGHMLAGSLKDVVMRYMTMQGYEIDKTPGYDCHGVPMEMAVNKKLNISSKEDVINIGIDKYCKECKSSVLTCAKDWADIMNIYGRWAKFETPYTTMDMKFCEKVWSMFSILFENDLIMQGYRVGAYSTALETSLSNFESALNYMQRNDQTLTFSVKLKKFKVDQYNNLDHYLSIFTTTPWTLPGNCAVAINKDAMYELNVKEDKVIIQVATPNGKGIKISGSQLIGEEYEPLFDFTNKFYGYRPDKFYKIYHGDFVKTSTDNSNSKEIGTGAVHIAPMFGEDDFNLCLVNGLIERTGLHLYNYLNSKGEIDIMVGTYFDTEYKPSVCFNNNAKIIKFIKTNLPHNFIKSEQMSHSYPHCWRTSTPLIYLATPSWLIAVTKFKDELIELNKTINWYPDHVGASRFHQWLQNARDWNISRARFWGTPLPIWKQVDGTDIIVVQSARHLEELCGLPANMITDLHRNHIDDLIIRRDGKEYKRIDAVFDCWFESGCVPYFFSEGETYQPADFIAEGLDQTRGWFYTLLVLGYVCSKVKNKDPVPAFKNVMVNGLVLAKDGKKMSKSLQNYTDPLIIVNKYGSDALRMYLLSSPASKAEDLKFDDDGVHKQMKNILIPFYNTLQFADIYKTLHRGKLSDFTNMGYLDVNNIIHPLNGWILEKTTELETNIHQCYKNYKLDHVISNLNNFVDVLNNGYVKLNRPFFKNQARDPEVNPITVESIHTINFVMLRLAYLMAPIAPYFAEYIFLTVKSVIGLDAESIHLSYYNEFYDQFNTKTKEEIHKQIEFIDYEFKLLECVRKLRSNNNLSKTKMLKRAFYYTTGFDHINEEFKDEMNIMDVKIYNLNEQPKIIKLIPKLNDQLIYNTFKKQGNLVKQLITSLNEDQLLNLQLGKNISLDSFLIEPNMIAEWNYSLLDTGMATLLKHLLNETNDTLDESKLISLVGSNFILFLDTTYNEEMVNNFYMQNIARRFQKMRKYAGLYPWDPVSLHLKTTNEKVIEVITKSEQAFSDITSKKLVMDVGTTKQIYQDTFNTKLDGDDIDVELYIYSLDEI